MDMKVNEIAIDYLKTGNYKDKSLFEKIQGLPELFIHLRNQNISKENISASDKIDIAKFLADDQNLVVYMIYYIGFNIDMIIDGAKVEAKVEKEEKKIDEDIKMKKEDTVDVKESDVPDMVYDLDYMKELGIEDPHE